MDVQNEQACTFRLDATPWDNVGEAWRTVLRYAEDIINGAATVDALEDRKRKDARQRRHLARQVLQGCTVVAHPCSYYLWLELGEGLRAYRVVVELERKGVLVTAAEPFAATPHVPHALRVALGLSGLGTLQRALCEIRAVVGH